MGKLDFAKERMYLMEEYSSTSVCSVIKEGVVIESCVTLGSHCYIGANAVIGVRGEEYAFDTDGIPFPVAHTGKVRIGNYVSIGAGVVVNRGLLSDDVTVIEDYAKIAGINVNHNCYVGEGSVIAAGVTMAGSCRIGKYCFIGIGATLGRVKIADYTLVGAGAVVLEDTNEYDIVVGNPAKFLRKRNVEDYFGK